LPLHIVNDITIYFFAKRFPSFFIKCPDSVFPAEQSIGGQELGTIWGHGAYVAPDWNADWLHREAVWMLNRYAADQFKKPYQQLDDEKKAMLQARLKKEIKTNTYQPDTGNLVISPLRAEAVSHLSRHYASLFGSDPKLDDLREKYAIPKGTVKNPERMKSLNAFLFWSTWACATNRPGSDITYTNNWPHEPLIGNHPTGEMVLWSVVSFVLLLAGVGALAWYYAKQQHDEIGSEDHFPDKDPLLALSPTPSMKATLKYFWVVGILWVVQVALGAITAHYQIEGSGFYGIPIAEWIPYSITRTWHTNWQYSGLPRLGSPPACLWLRRSPAVNQNINVCWSTFCLSAC
jgi:nitric oxide reductase subunit B